MDLKQFDIAFAGLKQGTHHFDYKIDNSFFENFGFDELNDADLMIKVELDKKSTLLELGFSVKGIVDVNCDLTNEPFELELHDQIELIVKFGDEYNDENEELLVLPHSEYKVNVGQYIYELCVLALPAKRVHPGVEDGSLQSPVLDKLEELSVQDPNDLENESTDPRWEALKNLKTDN